MPVQSTVAALNRSNPRFFAPMRLAGLLTLALGCLGSPASAAPQVRRDQIPPDLQPWIPWVLHGHEMELCPFLSGQGGTRSCVWPGRLELDLTDRGGSFAQRWRLDADGFVTLPGDPKRWPQQVRIDGRPAAAILRDGVPVVRLTSGEHSLSGAFLWDSLPESLAVPAQTGLLSLSLRGRDVPFPNRDEAGSVWLRDTKGGGAEEDALAVEVQRRVVDSVPLLLETRIELVVSGRSREIELAQVLPDGMIPMSLVGPLPARLESDGRLRVQARPGRWPMVLTGRHQGPVSELGLRQPDGPWASEEVWAFEARPDLRVVEVEGLTAIDPRQTRLPEEWQSLPAYLVRPGDRMTLTQRRRGDEDPTPDRLTLQRRLWLDFDGGGYSIQDVLTGTLSESWRLEMGPPSRLERVLAAGVDQVVTRREGVDAQGVELRQGRLTLAAESRVEGGFSAIPTVGWEHNFESVQGELNLPPGWRVLAAFGVDQAPGTWIDRWTLLDFFLTLILALAFRRLWGDLWGGIALATLILIYHEVGAPTWIFFPVLAAEALRRLLGPGRARRLARIGLWAGLVLLLLQSVPFSVRQIRVGLYPALEYSSPLGDDPVPSEDLTRQASITGQAMFSEPGKFPVSAQMIGGYALRRQEESAEYAQPQEQPAPVPAPKASLPDLRQIDPSLSVNTGSGLPRWSWNSIRLAWSGPVEAGQRMRFLLLPPSVNLLLALARVALLVLLTLRLLGLPGEFWPASLRGVAKVALILLALSAVCSSSPFVAAQVPPQETLDALRSRLLEKPACHPDCVEISRMLLETSPTALRGRLEVGAETEAAFPLPGGAGQWVPSQVLVDGQTSRVLLGEDGRIWVLAPAGTTQVLFEGPMPDREVVQLPLPLQPRRVEARGGGWSVVGLHEDGLAESALQLVRLRAATTTTAEAPPTAGLPPFVEVQRNLSLGLTWRMETLVRRLSPPGAPVSLAIPLLDGEAVTDPEARVQDGRVLITLASQALETSWSSRLPIRPEVSLQAADTTQWTEVWRLDLPPLWHVTPRGVPPVHPLQTPQVRVPEWRPWPGETLTLAIDRPTGVEGQSLTFDGSRLSLRPGIRSTDAELELAFRSSRGGQHTLTLPEGAELTAVTIDGQSLPVRQEGRQVTFPVDPGAHQARLEWREPRGVGLWFSNSDVKLPASGVNSLTELAFPSHRWILAAGGAGAGPAVLFWSLVGVILLVAAGLGRLGWTPLGTLQWALLGIGLSQIPWIAAAVVAGWLLVVGLRRTHAGKIKSRLLHNAAQLGLVFWTALALGLLFWAVTQGLLGAPETQIAGNASTPGDLRWFSDRWSGALPQAWVFSLPLFVYRLAMLAWALWLASSLLGWLRWGWESLIEGGGWRRRVVTAKPPASGG